MRCAGLCEEKRHAGRWRSKCGCMEGEGGRERRETRERESVGRARVSVALGGTVLGGRERHMDM